MRIGKAIAVATGSAVLAGATISAQTVGSMGPGHNLPVSDLLEVVQRIQQAGSRMCRSTINPSAPVAGIRQLQETRRCSSARPTAPMNG